MPASLKKRPKRRSGLITTVHPPTFNPLTAVYLENRLRPPGAAWSLLALSFILALRIHGADRISYGSKIWQTDDGLPNNSILSLAQTEDGYLWVGTQDGLARFNGIDFHVISNSAAPHLTRGRIGALLAASDGSLWIGCDSNGVTHLSRGEAKGITISNGLPNLDVRCFLETPEGGMWVGTEGGLVLFMGDTAKHFSVTNGLGDNSVRALAFDARGNVCAATKRGLSTIHGDGTVSTRLFPGRWNANALRAVSTDSGGDLWVGATDGLYHLSGTNIATYNRGEGLPDRIINTICRDFQGQLWIGTYGGIARVVNGEITAIPVGEATAEDMVNTIIEDQEHNMWAGTRDGLIRFTPVRFTTYTTQSGLSGNNVMSVLEDSKGATWLGIWGGAA